MKPHPPKDERNESDQKRQSTSDILEGHDLRRDNLPALKRARFPKFLQKLKETQYSTHAETPQIVTLYVWAVNKGIAQEREVCRDVRGRRERGKWKSEKVSEAGDSFRTEMLKLRATVYKNLFIITQNQFSFSTNHLICICGVCMLEFIVKAYPNIQKWNCNFIFF